VTLTRDEQALANKIAAEVISAMPDAVEGARRANYAMARQLTIAYISFASTVLITLFIDQNLPRWPLYMFAFFLFVTAGFWNLKADEYRRQGGDPHLLKQHQRRQGARIVVLVPLVVVLVAAFVMAGYAPAMLGAPLTVVFFLWLWDLVALMRAQGADHADRRAADAHDAGRYR